MKIKYFDVHTHVQDEQYDEDRDAVMRRALSAEVAMVQVGTDFLMSQKAIELAEKYDHVYATVGLHPTDNKKESFDHDAYKKLAEHPKVVAIGECGLDYFRIKGQGESEKDRQKEVFVKQIELAREVGKPLMIHCREAFPDLINILKKTITSPRSFSLVQRLAPRFRSFLPRFTIGGHAKNGEKPARKSNSFFSTGKIRGIIHFFSGTVKDAKELLEMGFYFSFGGVVTFVRDYDEQVKYIPLDRILLETDAPYVAPVPHRGKRNEPAYVVEVAKKIAEIKGATSDDMARMTTENARHVFEITT